MGDPIRWIIAESLIAQVEQYTGKVDYWRNSTQKQ